MTLCVAAMWLLVPTIAGPEPSERPQATERLSRFEFEETHMASPFKIVLYSTDLASARRACRAAFDRIAALDATLSDYDPESELSRLAQSAGGPPVPVSADLFDVLERSRRVYERSGGAFDVTIAPVGRLWRRARRDRKLPDAALLAKARSLVGSDKMVLDRKARTVRLEKPGMKLDVGGIAKGYASQAATRGAEGRRDPPCAGRRGRRHRCRRPASRRGGWTIAIAPLEPGKAAGSPGPLLLANAAVSTSGDAERFVVIDGHRYSHIINPATGMGVEDRASVTVVAPDGATADALETTVYILGPERGLKLVDETPGAAAIFVRKIEGGIKTFESSRFKTKVGGTQ